MNTPWKRGIGLPHVWLLVLIIFAGCGGDGPAPAEVAGQSEEPTAVNTVEATAVPTEPAVPTDTPAPTETPTPEPTETPLPTDTPAPTETPTPEPTETPLPTDTPAPTSTPLPPTPADTAAPPSPSPEPTADSITLYYRSNPSEVLGTFPVRPFDGAALYNKLLNLRSNLETMRGSIDGAHAGDAESCNTYVNAYNNILNAGVFYDDVPGDWTDIDIAYFLSFVFALDRTRPAYLSCINAGMVDDFNYGLAISALNSTLQLVNEAVNAAAAKQ